MLSRHEASFLIPGLVYRLGVSNKQLFASEDVGTIILLGSLKLGKGLLLHMIDTREM